MRITSRTVTIGFVATATAILATAAAAAADEPDRSRPPGMERMHELMMDGNPGMQRMQRMHMLERNPGMLRMHELMMGDGPSRPMRPAE